MNTYVHLWQYRAELFLKRKVFQLRVVEKIKTHILCSIFSPKTVPLNDNVEKYGGATQVTDDNITRRTRSACWITKTTHTHTQKTCDTTAPMVSQTHLCYVIRTLPVLNFDGYLATIWTWTQFTRQTL
jgi:hypothetical protein